MQYFFKALKTNVTIQYFFNTFNTARESCNFTRVYNLYISQSTTVSLQWFLLFKQLQLGLQIIPSVTSKHETLSTRHHGAKETTTRHCSLDTRVSAMVQQRIDDVLVTALGRHVEEGVAARVDAHR